MGVGGGGHPLVEEGENEEESTEGCTHSREAEREKEGGAWGLYKVGKRLAF